MRSPERIAHLKPRASGSISDFASGCWFCPGSTALISRDVFHSMGFFDERLRRLEDLDWFLRCQINVVPIIGSEINIAANANMIDVDAAISQLMFKFTLQDLIYA